MYLPSLYHSIIAPYAIFHELVDNIWIPHLHLEFCLMSDSSNGDMIQQKWAIQHFGRLLKLLKLVKKNENNGTIYNQILWGP